MSVCPLVLFHPEIEYGDQGRVSLADEAQIDRLWVGCEPPGPFPANHSLFDFEPAAFSHVNLAGGVK